MEIETMSSTIVAGDGKHGGKTGKLSRRKVNPKAPTKKKITSLYEVRRPTPTPNEAEEMSAESASIEFAGMRMDGEAGPSATGKEEEAGGGEGEADARPISREGEKADVLERRPSPPTRDDEEEEEEMSAEEEFKEENQIPIFHKFWERIWGGYFGSFHDETSIGPMKYTSQPNARGCQLEKTLQIFSIRVMDLTDGLEWPLHVHGYVAARDTIDHKRNYLFRRTKDNCQTLTKNDPLLHLTGPSRAAVLVDPIFFEVELKVKRKAESEDEMLAFGTFEVMERFNGKDGFLRFEYHRRCILQYKFALLVRSVEATISVRVADGSWPDNHAGKVFCLTSGVDEKVVLLDSRDGEMPIDANGVIKLSRRVVSAESNGKFLVAVDACQTSFLARCSAIFKPKNYGTSRKMCDLGFCKMEVTVAWSLFNVFAM